MLIDDKDTESKTLSLSEELGAAFDSAETADTVTESDASPSAFVADATLKDPTVSADPNAATEIADQPLTPQEHWSAPEKEAFSKLPRDVQKIWLDREDNIRRGLDGKFKEIASFKKERDDIQEVFAPYARDMQLAGTTMTQAIRQLVAAHSFITEDPVKGLAWMAQNYGVDLAKLPELLAGSGREDTSPAFMKLQDEFNGVKSQLEKFTGEQTQQHRTAQVQQIQQFADEVGADGKPLRPYFDEVGEDILRLLRGGERDLSKAYDAAIWANPQTRDRVMADRQRADQFAKQGKINEAKRAGFSVESSNTGNVTTPKSLRDELSAAFEAA